jgi:hypothetical protein
MITQELQDGGLSIFLPSMPLEETLATIPACFSSVLESRTYMDLLVHHWLLLEFKVADDTAASAPMTELHLDFVRGFERWTNAFTNLLEAAQRHNLFSETDRGEAQLLQIRTLHYAIILGHNNKCRGCIEDEMLWDDFIAEYRQMVSLAETFLEQSSHRTTPIFSLEHGIVSPMYFAALQCREPTVRRRALDILQHYPRREGFWDSVRSAQIAERCISLEENDEEDFNLGVEPVENTSNPATVAVPLRRRIVGVRPEFRWEDQVSTLHYSRLGKGAASAWEREEILPC